MAVSPPRVDIEAFLKRFVEGYLFGDLETMKVSGPQDAERPGHLGYSMALVGCSGVELLGSLTDDREFSVNLGREYFAAYWSGYLYSGNAVLALPIYKLIRHGLAHSFMTRRNIVITKGQPDIHLSFTDGVFRFDVTRFADDLRRSYENEFRPRLDLNRAQIRLDERLRQWTDDSPQWEALTSAGARGVSPDPLFLNVSVPASGHPLWPPHRVTASGVDTLHTTAVNSPAPGTDES